MTTTKGLLRLKDILDRDNFITQELKEVEEELYKDWDPSLSERFQLTELLVNAGENIIAYLSFDKKGEVEGKEVIAPFDSDYLISTTSGL